MNDGWRKKNALLEHIIVSTHLCPIYYYHTVETGLAFLSILAAALAQSPSMVFHLPLAATSRNHL